MIKKTKKYTVKVSEQNGSETLDLAFEIHEDLYEIIRLAREKQLFDPAETATFVTGLKMFSSVMLRHRDSALFEEFAPAFRSFMKKLKES